MAGMEVVLMKAFAFVFIIALGYGLKRIGFFHAQDFYLLSSHVGLLEKVFDGRMDLMLNTMVEKRAFSREEITEMYEILRKAEMENRNSQGEDNI